MVNLTVQLFNLHVSLLKQEKMYLHCFVISLLITLTFANGVNQSKVEVTELRAINFAKEIKGRKLNGSVIKEKDVYTEYDCQIDCVADSRCLSYNFGPSEDKKKLKCQLCDSDRFVGLKNFTKDDKVMYRGIKVTYQYLLGKIRAKLERNSVAI